MRIWGFLLLLTAAVVLMTPSHAMAQEPWGTISAEPNPCQITPGNEFCTAHVRWETRGVSHAKVFVIAEGRHTFKEREFGDGVKCEEHRCKADWIKAETRYKFQLFDFTRGDRGRLLASVTVTGAK